MALDRDELTQSVAITAGTVTLNFNGFTLSAVDGLSISNGATLKGAGTIVGDVTNAGTLAPGNSPGSLTIDGDLVLQNGSLVLMEIAGPSSGQYDVLTVTGNMTQDGILRRVLGS